jgi:hypothetical protein
MPQPHHACAERGTAFLRHFVSVDVVDLGVAEYSLPLAGVKYGDYPIRGLLTNPSGRMKFLYRDVDDLHVVQVVKLRTAVQRHSLVDGLFLLCA